MNRNLGPQFIHRGVRTTDVSGLDEEAGSHWSSDRQTAEGHALKHLMFSDPSHSHVVLTAEHPGAEHVVRDPEWLQKHGVGQYAGDEHEVPVRPGSPLHVTGMSVWQPDRKDPMDGVWEHHSMDKVVRA